MLNCRNSLKETTKEWVNDKIDGLMIVISILDE